MNKTEEKKMDKNIENVEERAYRIRKNAIRMGEVQQQGFIAQALGVADVMAVAYFHAMNYLPQEPNWEGRDRFLLSVGHIAIGHYAALAEAGFIPEDELDTYACDDSRLPMSGMTSYTPGMEMSGGSIGLGLPMAVGMGFGLKQKKSSSLVYTLMGDGELAEGPTWEAAISAANYNLDNVIAIIDVNGIQADGLTVNIMNTEPLHEKFEAFGWYVQRVDGNDLSA
ncbi:MAG: thiamine pyrophosphate-dependent enzyme, partial [Clostridia bacterium]|nr:thiamine pyrophosphate-dependent enzyme [Clostridia bacterium]